jgi:hypothetical protein
MAAAGMDRARLLALLGLGGHRSPATGMGREAMRAGVRGHRHRRRSTPLEPDVHSRPRAVSPRPPPTGCSGSKAEICKVSPCDPSATMVMDDWFDEADLAQLREEMLRAHRAWTLAGRPARDDDGLSPEQVQSRLHARRALNAYSARRNRYRTPRIVRPLTHCPDRSAWPPARSCDTSSACLARGVSGVAAG